MYIVMISDSSSWADVANNVPLLNVNELSAAWSTILSNEQLSSYSIVNVPSFSPTHHPNPKYISRLSDDRLNGIKTQFDITSQHHTVLWRDNNSISHACSGKAPFTLAL